MEEQILEIDNDSLEMLNKFSLFPMVLYNSYKIFFSNDKFDKVLSYDQLDKVKNQMKFNSDKIKNCNREFYLEDKEKNKKWYELVCQFVEYNGESCVLAYFVDISSKKENERKIQKISKLRALMLEVTQAILQQEDLDEIFQLILRNSLKSMDNAALGTILIRDGEFLNVASSIGFVKDIDQFNLPVKECFLYKQTEGRLDKIININDLTDYEGHIPVKTCLGEDIYIKATLSAPIYINDNFFGMINIDSIKKNAFDELDFKTMEFIKRNIEIALANHFLYQEKIFLARYDPLTQIFNRGYFEEQFSLILESSIRYRNPFCLIVFDVDGLKKINDNYGHLVGDKVIKQVAKVLEENKRKSDLIARIGGDEFAGVYLHSNKKLLSRKFNLIVNQLKNNLIELKDEQQILYSFTFGIATFPQDGETFEQLFKVADNRMYLKKKTFYIKNNNIGDLEI